MDKNLLDPAEYFQTSVPEKPDQHQVPLSAAIRKQAIQKAYLHPKMEVVILGVANVSMAKQLAPLVNTVQVVESTAQKLRTARRRLEALQNLQFQRMDGDHLPFADASLDACFATLTLQHAREPLAAIQEMVRVLKPGGRLMLIELKKSTSQAAPADSVEPTPGFERAELSDWMNQADLVNRVSLGVAEVGKPPTASMFLASGSRRVRARDLVQAGYAARAESNSGCCGSGENAAQTCCTPENIIPAQAILESISLLPGYSTTQVAGVPAEAASLSLGCGNPTALAELKPGETVLDIGSGGGIDVFLAARQVGSSGRVIGVDMTPAMLERAQRAAAKAGLANIEFRQGYAEALPVADQSVDVVISNCVLNLTEDKGLAWREAYRVLRPGGRVAISDVATDICLPLHLRLDARGWSECVTGALPLEETVDLMRQAGFGEITTQPNTKPGDVEGVQVFSTLFSGRKRI